MGREADSARPAAERETRMKARAVIEDTPEHRCYECGGDDRICGHPDVPETPHRCIQCVTCKGWNCSLAQTTCFCARAASSGGASR